MGPSPCRCTSCCSCLLSRDAMHRACGRTQGRARRECFHFDIAAPPRGWPERVPLLERIPRDKELDAVSQQALAQV